MSGAKERVALRDIPPYIRHMINGNQPREKPPIDHWKFMQKFYDMGSSFDRLADLARVQGWVESDQLQAAKEAYLDLIRQIGNRMILPEKVDIKGTLERGRQVAEQDIWEGR